MRELNIHEIETVSGGIAVPEIVTQFITFVTSYTPPELVPHLPWLGATVLSWFSCVTFGANFICHLLACGGPFVYFNPFNLHL